MKRTLAIVLALLMVFCLFAACGEKKEESKAPDNTQSNTQTNTQTGSNATTGQGAGGSNATTGQGSQVGAGAAQQITTNELNFSWTDLHDIETHPSAEKSLGLCHKPK